MTVVAVDQAISLIEPNFIYLQVFSPNHKDPIMRDCDLIHLLKNDLEHPRAEPESQVSILYHLSLLFVVRLLWTTDTFAIYWFASMIFVILPELLDTSAGYGQILCYILRWNSIQLLANDPMDLSPIQLHVLS